MNAGPHSVVQTTPWALHVLAPVHLQMTTYVKGPFPRAQKLGTLLTHETKPRRSKGRIGLSELPLRLPPSSQFRINLCLVFLKFWMTPNPRNDERRRNLHQTGRTRRAIGRLLIPWRRARTLRETSKNFFYAHLCQPDRINDPARKASLQIGAMLIEIVVRIAHVRVFRLVTDFRREFRVTAMDVRNV